MIEWQDQANCRNEKRADRLFDDDKFIRQSAAKEFCSTCPVVKECLQDGLDLRERFGVRGGVDQDKLRETQHIDGFGRASSTKISSLVCLYCETEVPLSETGTQEVMCPTCSLEWKAEFK